MFVKKRSARVFPIRKAKKKGAAKEVLDRLNEYLEAEDAEPVKWLTRFWGDQQKAITYKELREAIIAGQISEKTIKEWQISYSHLVSTKMDTLWEDAMRTANKQITNSLKGFYFDPTAKGAKDWITAHGAQWVTMVGDEQQNAISALLRRAYSGDWTVDELARAIRPTIGLTGPQAQANINYYNHVKETLLKENPTMRAATAEKRAREAALKYAEKQHRQRAFTIADTEMAFAYNKGADEGIRQAQERGYLGKVKRVWSTAGDELVCPICGALDGTAIDMDDEFYFQGRTLYSGQKQTPPAHPRCRCACSYEEVEPPRYEPAGLMHDEEGALKRYMSSDSYKINEKLRDGKPLKEKEYSFMINLDITLSKMPRYEGTLTRSLHFISEEGKKQFLKNHVKGSIIEYEQYISTTKGAIYNPSAAVQIIILYAVNGRDISSYNQAEKEVLYERNSRFRVVDVNETEDGITIVTLEEYSL